MSPRGTLTAQTQVPTTQVTDTIYRADGTAATGTVVISWPAFTTSNGLTVPAGSTSVTIGAGRSVQRGAGSECGIEPDGQLLHGGVSSG